MDEGVHGENMRLSFGVPWGSIHRRRRWFRSAKSTNKGAMPAPESARRGQRLVRWVG